jgi:hypothetical protein
MIKKSLYILLVISLHSNELHAESLGFGNLFSFAETNREVITQLDEIRPLARPNFRLTRSEADAMMELSQLDSEIEGYAYAPSSGDCDEEEQARAELRERIEGRPVRLLFAMSYSDDETSDNLYHMIHRESYGGFIAHARLNGATPTPSRNLDALRSDYESTTGQSLAAMSLSEQSRALEEFINNKYSIDVPRDFLVEEVLRDHIIANPNDWRQSVSSIADDLNFDQKMRISARMGETFLSQYNSTRAAGGPDGNAVTMEQLLQSAQDGTPGGVCRDISFAQSQLLQEMGVDRDNIFIVAYASPGSSHSVLAVQDPNNPDRLVKLNYGQMTEDTENTGGSALRQTTSLPDVGISYKIYDADASPIGLVPTELGSLLREVTNAPPSFIEYTPYNLSTVTADSELGSFRVFTGTTTSGDTVIGGAFDTTVIDNQHRRTELGIAAVRHEINSPIVDLRQDLIYARLQQEFYSSPINTGPVQSRFEIGFQTELLYGRHTGEKISSGSAIEGNTLDISGTIFTGVTSSFEAGESRVRTDLRTHLYADFANETKSGDITAVHDRTEARVQVEHQFSPDIIALAEGGLVLRNYGEAASFQFGLEDPDQNYRGFASYSTPIGDVPSFMPEAGQTLRIGFEASPPRSGWSFSATGERDLDRDDNRYFLAVRRQF